ncbi:3-keto-steroid reductase/17-beta-hydroxysteroid dehydrogenase 7-like isoform X3 [Biomphalaria glabrata]|nr:3-keto-steroid reductase/17-beta-hydroxysteroid dehydrogenase 7-like isoform X3 [Biomphalaria glabrata]XP_055887466.1 3-keto-steroid reductase/17-beta-hydroxysteroid dehydrogenase 7-like isoform X3 [Biomphalaria glabrata]XP_055887471.1 3-keto-steroid reductase/17-beta-hydroxysteroid dehydrogenase 7-like isoform X3 [Biomphalaria glabrata]XP_055887476.1 3-keto-steroid reductase/17-beta-hydroxysteroid dehydrogenase 7-like isoform X3 [Biomphalaria glabrata]XP_055887478.1 3-keto-steroid reductase
MESIQSSILQKSKVAVITGANAGLGFTLADRLLSFYPDIQICLACRNKERGLTAAAALTEKHPKANVHVEILDTSSVASVLSGTEAIRKRYDHIDYLYLNAGIMKVTGVDWNYFWKGLLSSRVFYMFATGEGLLCQEDGVTEDGLQCVFQTNVFGHYVMVKELEDRLGNVSSTEQKPSQIIWTSSSASQAKNFKIEDFQHKNGKDPYSSSKFAIDILSVALNEKMNKQNVFSHSVCPGLVMTNMTYGILPQWFWTLMIPLLWLLHFFVPSMTNNTENGTEALIWLSAQDPMTLDPQTKYMSHVNVFNKSYVAKSKMNINPELAEKFIQELDQLNNSFQLKLKSKVKN